MNFFKKLLGTQDKISEHLNEDQIKSDKKQLLKQQKVELKRKVAEEKQMRREAKKVQERALQEKYIGVGFGKGLEFSAYKRTIEYFETSILRTGEEVLHSITAEYDKTKKREIKGLLIATNERLVFVSSGVGYGQFFEEFDYRKMNGISQASDGLFEKEIYIDMGRSRKKFDDIIPDDRFKQFVSVIMQQVNTARNTSQPRRVATPRENTNQVPTIDKYEALEKIAKLKEQGILTEEEFQKEKDKILKM